VSARPLRVVGRPVPRVDALEKVTGRARYVTDLTMPGMVHAKVVRSPYAHARVTRVDVARARALLRAGKGRELAHAHELRGAGNRVVGIAQLHAADLHTVPVDQRRRLRQRHAVHADSRAIARPANDHVIVGSQLEDGLEAEARVIRHAHIDAGPRADARLPSLECVLFVVDLNDRH